MDKDKVYVTFQFKSLLFGVKKYAIECESREAATQLSYDLNSLVGIRYLRINKTGVFPKGTEVKKSINEIFG